MLRFFSKLRYQLAAENKVAKYLRYAIGEIILVVIGILFALQVNNWNEIRKIKIKETNFFNEILTDLQKDKDKLNYLERYLQNRIICDDTLLFFVRNPDLKMGLAKFGRYAEPLFYGEKAISNSVTFEAAKTSEAYNGYQEKGLIKELTQYYSDFESLEKNMTDIQILIENRFEPLMATISKGYFNESTGTLVVTEESVITQEGVMNFYRNVAAIKDNRKALADYGSILKNPEFESYLVGDLGRVFGAMGKIDARQVRIKTLEKKINDFLNKP